MKFYRQAMKTDWQVWTWNSNTGEDILHEILQRAMKSDRQVWTWSSNIGEDKLHKILQRAMKIDRQVWTWGSSIERICCVNFTGSHEKWQTSHELV